MKFNEDFTVINPGCGCARFAVPTETYNRWRKTHAWWHCPHCGGQRHYTGPSVEQQRLAWLEGRIAATLRAQLAERDEQLAKIRKLDSKAFEAWQTTRRELEERANAAEARERELVGALQDIEEGLANEGAAHPADPLHPIWTRADAALASRKG